MTAGDIVRALLRKSGIGVSALAGRLNIKQNTLSMRLNQPNISIDKLNEMLRVLDYKVVVVPRESRIPDGGYEVE